MHERTIGILTTCMDSWGGSEELWGKSVPLLQSAGYRTIVAKVGIPKTHPKFVKLAESGTLFFDLAARPVIHKVCDRIKIKFARYFNRNTTLPGFVQTPQVGCFKVFLRRYQPSLVVISQGINFDALGYAHTCLSVGIPYVIVSHKAVDFYWPLDGDRALMRSILLNASQCFFVSRHNRRLTEEQFGVRLPGSTVIFNPVKKVPYISYPDSTNGYRLCCMGRLFVLDKGQDMLIRIMSKETWKKRPVHILFVGSGIDETGLKEMAELLDVKNVTFTGQIGDTIEVWKECHALLLPSRSEGLPLVIAEAMMVGRPVIATRVGGNAEFLQEGVTGFIGYADDEGFEATMEQAWSQRERWEDMGRNATRLIGNTIPESPERIFVDKLLARL